MKKYVLIVSTYYPNHHPLAGRETRFVTGIKTGSKIHTIRKNLNLWQKRAKEVQEGRAIISVRVWTGLPYQSPQAEIFQFAKIGVEHLLKVDGKYQVGAQTIDRATLAANDGLSEQAFIDWFCDDSAPTISDLAIIHFTDFRYEDHRGK